MRGMVLIGIRELFSIKGRINRKKYIVYFLWVNIFTIIMGIESFYFLRYLAYLAPLPNYFGALAIIVPMFIGIGGRVARYCLSVKRLHDINNNGLIAFVIFIPGVEILLMLYLFMIKGNEGFNAYGSDPIKINYLEE